MVMYRKSSNVLILKVEDRYVSSCQTKHAYLDYGTEQREEETLSVVIPKQAPISTAP